MSDVQCVICDKVLADGTPTTVVREKGLQTFVESSKKRGDGKTVYFKSSASIEFHEKCRRQYTNEKLVAAAVKRARENDSKHPLGLRSCNSDPTFSFKTHCFICGNVISPNYGKS